MKKWLLSLLALVTVVFAASPTARQSFTAQVQQLASAIGYTSSTSQFAQYTKSVVYPVSAYVNFGGAFGSGSYGIRDNAGTMQFRNSTGAWTAIPATGGAGGNVKFIVQTPDGTVPNAQALSALATGLVLNTTTTGVLSTSLLLPATNFPALTGAITTPGGSLVSTLTNAIVTLAKIQNATANSRILCAGSAGSGASYSECTLGSGLSLAGTVLSSTAAAISTTGGTGAIQYNTAGAFDSSTGLVWTQGSTLLTVTGTTKTTSFLIGNNTPSLTSPRNAAMALSQTYTTAFGSTQNSGATLQTVWAPSANVSGVNDGLFVNSILQGTHAFSADTYGSHLHAESQTSGLVSKLEGARVESSVTTGSGTVSTLIGVGGDVHADHGTATEARVFYAYSPEVGTSGTITRGIEYYGTDPLSSACTACLSEFLDFGSRGGVYVSPEPAILGSTFAGHGYSYLTLQAVSTSNADFGAGFNALMNVGTTITPSADFSLGAIEGVGANLTFHAAHNYSTAIIGTAGDVDILDGAGNFTESTTGLNGLQGELDFYGSGTVTAGSAIQTFFGSGGGGVITNGQSIWVTTPYDTTSIVTNYVGLRIDNQSWPGSTTNYAILYSAPASKTFAVLANGNLTLGGATMTFPATNAAGVLTNNGSGTLSWSTTGLFPLFAPAGTNTAPSFSWTTAHGVGLYEPSTNQTGIVGGVILGKSTSAAHGSELFLSGSGIAAVGGNALVQMDLEPGLDTLQTIPVGQNGEGLYLNPVFSSSASGTNPLIANAYFDAGTWTNGGATITEATTLYVAGAPSIGASKYALHVAAGLSKFDGGILLKPIVFASLPASPVAGMVFAISDSTTQTWGATAAGGSSSYAVVTYDGANWTVMGK